jgi:HK97 family phage major capsid protein
METVSLNIIKSWGSFEVGKTYDVDAPTAASLVEGGYAEKPTKSFVESVGDELGAAVREQVSAIVPEITANCVKAVTEQIRKNPVRVPAVAADPEECKFGKDATQNLALAMLGETSEEREKGHNQLVNRYKMVRKANTLVSGTGSLGGYAVPNVNDLVIRYTNGYAPIMRSGANVVACPGELYSFNFLNQGSSFFPSAAYYEGENTTSQQTDFSIKKGTLKPTRLSNHIRVSNSLLASNPGDVDAQVGRNLIAAHVKKQERSFWVGTGAGPQGILKAAGRLAVARVEANKIQLNDILNLMSHMLPDEAQNYVFTCSPAALAPLWKLKDEAGRIMTITGTGDQLSRSILGIPLYVNPYQATAYSEGDVALVNRSHYIVADRQEVVLSASREVGFLTNETIVLCESWTDGALDVDAPFVLEDDSTFKFSFSLVLADAS